MRFGVIHLLPLFLIFLIGSLAVVIVRENPNLSPPFHYANSDPHSDFNSNPYFGF